MEAGLMAKSSQDSELSTPQDVPGSGQHLRKYHETKCGVIYHGDSRLLFERHVAPGSVDLIVTSPPFGLVRKKTYGNADAHQYLAWFKPFGEAFFRALKPSGSLVIDIGGAWIPGQPTRSLYHYELLIMLCRECGFHLAQDFFWWNPAKLPTPAEWVTVRRVRVKDAINCIWWLSKTPWPKASNRRVLVPYSDSMKDLLKNGYKAKLRPSGHDISQKFSIDNKAAIPPNLIAVANTESNSQYLRYCIQHDLRAHPARFPADIPEYFVRMLTDPADLVIDPFAGSCVTGEVAERLGRRWLCGELVEDYLKGALARFRSFPESQCSFFDVSTKKREKSTSYKLCHPASIWAESEETPLSEDGGKNRPVLANGRKTQIARRNPR
jgi:site-specific DNA-methyltransferase (cytosine-N4-specific)